MAHGLRLGVGVLVLSTAVGCWSTDKAPSTFPATVKLPDPKLPAAAPAAKGTTASRPASSTPVPVQTTAAGPTDRFGRPAGTAPSTPDAGPPVTQPGMTVVPPAPAVPNNAASFRDPPPLPRPTPPADGGSPIVSPPTVKPLAMPEPPAPPTLPAVAPPTAKADAPAAPSLPTAPIVVPTVGGDGK